RGTIRDYRGPSSRTIRAGCRDRGWRNRRDVRATRGCGQDRRGVPRAPAGGCAGPTATGRCPAGAVTLGAFRNGWAARSGGAALTTLSLCVIARDGELNLPLCLSSVRGIVDETIVAGTGSADRAPEIAGSLGARVVPFAWRD